MRPKPQPQQPAPAARLVAERRRRPEDEDDETPRKSWARATFLAAAARRKEKGRPEGEGGEEVMPGDILSAATSEEIGPLLKVKSKLYPRLSDGCLYETGRVDGAVKHPGRGRNRRATCVTGRAEAK